VGSSNSLLRASSNTYSADESDVLAAEEDSGNQSDSKLPVKITTDNINGLPGDIITVYATITDLDGNPITRGTAIFSSYGKTYYASVTQGLAEFRGVELPLEDSVEELSYIDDVVYENTSVLVNVTVEYPQEDYDNDYFEEDTAMGGDEIPTDNNSSSNDQNSDSNKESISKLQQNPAGNPVLVLLLALMTIFGSGIFRIRK